MKLSAMIVALVICSSSFAATVLNGVTLTNLPKASKTYTKEVLNDGEIVPVQDALRAECLNDKKSAEAFLTRSGSKILASTGCSVSVVPGYSDQGGYAPTRVTTGFEVTFK